MMKRFESDYLEGAHPDVLRALIETNGEQTPGYGEDPHCEAARALLRERCELPEGEVQFLVGGTVSTLWPEFSIAPVSCAAMWPVSAATTP